MNPFPGQVDRIFLTIEQMRVLASVIRSEVFYMYTPMEPRAVSEIAAGLGKSPQTIHYHTNELVESGLLIAVEERKSYARTEKLYVHKGLDTFTGYSYKESAEYREEIVNGMQAVFRTMGREMAEAQEAIGLDDEIAKLVAYQQNVIRVSAEHAQEIRRRLYELRQALLEYDDPNGQYRVRTAVYMAPSIETSRKVTKNRRSVRKKKGA
jgi:DNA-binding transcriptional ArsR family regulator